MANDVPPSITVVVDDSGKTGKAVATSQPQGPLIVSEPIYVKPATVDDIQVTPVAGENEPLDHLAAFRAGVTDLARYYAVIQRPDGKVEYLNASDQSARKAFLGIVLNPAVAGRKTTICIHGVISNANWNWQPGPVYCGDGGVLTQDMNQNTYQVAQAVTPTMLIVGSLGASPVDATVGAPTTFVWQAPTASLTWTIYHGMERYPSVTLVDSAHRVIMADITYVDINTVSVDFAYATGGSAYLV